MLLTLIKNGLVIYSLELKALLLIFIFGYIFFFKQECLMKYLLREFSENGDRDGRVKCLCCCTIRLNLITFSAKKIL